MCYPHNVLVSEVGLDWHLVHEARTPQWGLALLSLHHLDGVLLFVGHIHSQLNPTMFFIILLGISSLTDGVDYEITVIQNWGVPKWITIKLNHYIIFLKQWLYKNQFSMSVRNRFSGSLTCFLNINKLWSISPIISNFETDLAASNNYYEWWGGTTVSLLPWINKIGHRTFSIFSKFLNLSFTS